MLTRILLSLFCFVIGLTSVTAASPDDFSQANQQFKSGNFAAAAAMYERIIEAQGPSAAALYNLGNSYQKLGKTGLAILAYERARLLTPRDPDLLANLALARKAVAAFEEPRYHARLDAVLDFFSRNEWSWWVVGSAFYVGILSLLVGVVRLPRSWMRQLAVASGCLAVFVILLGGSALYLRHDEASRGIVISDAATVRLSPFENAESLGTPGPGRIVQMRGENGGFHYIEVPGSQLRGWISSKDVAAILSD